MGEISVEELMAEGSEEQEEKVKKKPAKMAKEKVVGAIAKLDKELDKYITPANPPKDCKALARAIALLSAVEFVEYRAAHFTARAQNEGDIVNIARQFTAFIEGE